MLTRTALALALLLATAAGAAEKDPVLVTVDGTEITASMLQRYARQRGMDPGQLNAQLRRSLLEELVNRELIYRDGLRKGVDKDPDVVRTIEDQRINIIASATLSRMSELMDIDEAALRREYEKRADELGGTEYKARHILQETEAEARATIAELDKGADFATLAKAKSTGPSASQGGDLGWFRAEQMVAPFAAAVRGLKKGEYSKEPVHTQFGWHVILLEDTRKVAPPSFESLKEQLRLNVRNQRLRAYIDGLRQKAKVEFSSP